MVVFGGDGVLLKGIGVQRGPIKSPASPTQRALPGPSWRPALFPAWGTVWTMEQVGRAGSPPRKGASGRKKRKPEKPSPRLLQSRIWWATRGS